MLVALSLLVVVVVLALLLREKDPRPILGVYHQPGRWYFLKYALVWLMLAARKKKDSSRDGGNQSQKQVGYGRTLHSSVEEMEVAQPLSDHPKAFDAVFFMGTSTEGYYFVLGTERRKHGIINGLCYLMTPDRGLLCSRKVPDTVLFGAKEQQFGAEGLLVTPLQPMKTWRVQYDGDMWPKNNPEEVLRVKIELTFCSDWKYFNFDTDLHPSALCRALAREVWTREYFDNLKKAHQTHYEQMGFLNGTATIGDEVLQLKLQGFRDHSYGDKRDWDLMHRYAFHMFFLENGLRVTIGVICQPCTCSVLESGYVYTPDGEVYPLEWCDFRLYQHGEGGYPPLDYAFQFKAGREVYTAQVAELCRSVHHVGWRWEARMVERFLNCEVNGVKGRGISEFHYHHEGGRPLTASAADPNWFAQIRDT